MIGMANSTGNGWIAEHYCPMQAGWFNSLTGDCRVTGFTARIHAGFIPEGRMTKLTFAGKLTMGSIATDPGSGLVVERSWAEYHPTLEQGDYDDHD
jgi:hypothetical protein